MNPSDSVQCMRSGNGVVRYSVGSLCEHGEQEVVGAAAGSSAIHTTVPRPQPEEPLEESITENEEEPEYSNYGALAENDMDEIQERRNANELQIAQTLRLAYAANNLHDHDEPPAGEEMENVTLVNSRIEHIHQQNVENQI